LQGGDDVDEEDGYAAYTRWREKWSHYDGDSSDAPAYVCQRCGAAIGEFMTDTHDKFHDQIDALMAERK
jgi:hypothetical protein